MPHRLQVSFVVGEGDEQPYLHRLWVGGTQDVTFCVDVSDAEWRLGCSFRACS